MKKYFHVRASSPKPGVLRRILRCKECDSTFTYPWQPMTAGAVLQLLNHAYGHNVPRAIEESVPAYHAD